MQNYALSNFIFDIVTHITNGFISHTDFTIHNKSMQMVYKI